MFRGRVRHVHFVGVGGVGMSGLAEILRSLEFDVSGSDLKEGSTTRRLESNSSQSRGPTSSGATLSVPVVSRSRPAQRIRSSAVAPRSWAA